MGAFGQSLTHTTATQLATHATHAAIQNANLQPSLVDEVVLGNVQQTSHDAAYLARHAALTADIPIDKPALIVNRLCGSGFQAIVDVAKNIQLGETNIAVAGGTESMSQAPMAAYGQHVRFGTRLGTDLKLTDTLWAGLTDSQAGCAMGITAENLASDFGITREESDLFALNSQRKWAKAQANGDFAAEVAPMTLPGKKGSSVEFSVDEPPRETTLDKLGKLPTTFKKNGVVTPGSASGIADGAASLVVASERAVLDHNLKPLAEIVSWAVVGVEPTRMGIGPVPAINMALAKVQLSLSKMDLIEINEAFAPQVLACAVELGLDPANLNKRGGAIALGHPLGASGARITAHLAHMLAQGKGQYAIGAACIGGGQGISLVLKSVQ